MATTTPNFGWDIPQSTDLVKDGATAIAALGNDIDTSMVDLKGGTTGQVLSKASNTDMDFTWINNDQGDITGVTAGTGLTGGGTSGAVTLDFDVANYGGGQWAAGKNKIINGDLGIWQRGTSFSLSSAVVTYTADRFVCYADGTVTCTASRQAFTAGTAPVSGYESQYFLRTNTTAQSGGSGTYQGQRIEDVRTFANQTITFSLWAKADSARTYNLYLAQNFGSGGSATVNTSAQSISVTTSWQRFSFTVALGSISGKTIGTGSSLEAWIYGAANTANTLDTWGWQVEAGSTATLFQTATGTIQGELAACQRYFQIFSNGANYLSIGTGSYWSTTSVYVTLPTKVTMRTSPTATFSGGATGATVYVAGSTRVSTAITSNTSHPDLFEFLITTAADTAGRAADVNVNSNATLTLSAEL